MLMEKPASAPAPGTSNTKLPSSQPEISTLVAPPAAVELVVEKKATPEDLSIENATVGEVKSGGGSVRTHRMASI